MPIDAPHDFSWRTTVRRGVQTVVFCVLIALLFLWVSPEKRFIVSLVYALFIGLACWLLIDLGRRALPSARATGWPAGWRGLAFPVAAIVAAFFIGTAVADAWFGWSSWDAVGRSYAPRSIIITAAAGVMGSYYAWSRAHAQALRTRIAQAEHRAAQAQLTLLQSQLEPHMLFNTLANLRALIDTDAPRAQAMLDHLIGFLRATLGASRAATHSLRAEYELLRDYLELMAVRMGPRLAYTLEVPADLADARVPTLILQPLVENAIRHGLEPQVAGGRITVTARREGDALVLQVQDNGAGLPAAAALSGESGFGLAQVRERLATLYGDQAAIELIAASAGGTSASVRFPFAS